LYCDSSDLGVASLHNVNNIRHNKLFGVIYKWSEETLLAIYDVRNKLYRLVTEVGHVASFTGLKEDSRIVHQIMTYNAILRHYALAKVKYPSFKAKLRDIAIDDGRGLVSCSFNCLKRGVEFMYRGSFKNSINTYGDIEFRASSKEKPDALVAILDRLQLKSDSPMNVTLFCDRLMKSFVYLTELDEVENKPNMKITLF